MSDEKKSLDPVGARTLRQMLRAAGTATLATALPPDGHPHASLVEVAWDLDGSPVLLLSGLAEHSRALAADPRAALLIDGTAGRDEPLTGPRLSLAGRVAPDPTPRLADRYRRRHPGAARYAGFGDFAIRRMTLTRAHLVAGFGKIRWLAAPELLVAEDWGALAAAEDDIVTHMNTDHTDAIQLYATRLLGAADDEGWTMTGIDPDGADLRRQARCLRLPFDNPVADAEAARRELVALVRRARSLPA
jgi:putative heme iron utilization protein